MYFFSYVRQIFNVDPSGQSLEICWNTEDAQQLKDGPCLKRLYSMLTEVLRQSDNSVGRAAVI